MEFEARYQFELEDYDVLQQVARQAKKGWKRYKAPVVRGFVFLVGLGFVLRGLLADGHSEDYCFILGGFLMIYAFLVGSFASSARKQAEDDAKRGEIVVLFTEETVSLSDAVSSTQWQYTAFQGFYHKKDRYFLKINDHKFMLIPETAFISGNPAEFEDFITHKTGLALQYLK